MCKLCVFGDLEGFAGWIEGRFEVDQVAFAQVTPGGFVVQIDCFYVVHFLVEVDYLEVGLRLAGTAGSV
jgi:hypothetical protein